MAAEDLNILIKAQLDMSQKAIKDINKQIQILAQQLDKIDLNLDTTKLDNVAKAFTKSTEKIKKEQQSVQKVFKDSQLSGEGYTDLQKRVEEIKKATDQYAKVTVQTYKNTKNLKSATVEYRDELGRLVKEQLKWTEYVDKQNNTKKKVFQTTGFTFVDDIAKQQKAEIDMQEALLDTEKKRRLEYKKLEEQQAKAINKSLELEYQRGEKIGTYNNLKGNKVTEEQLEGILRLNKAYKDQEIREISLDRVTGKWNVTLKENSKQNRIVKGTIDQTTGALYKQSEAIKMASAKNLGFFEQFKIALSRVNISPLY